MKHSVEFDAFDKVVGKVLAVTREELQRREKEYRIKVEQNPHRRGPKPKVKSSDRVSGGRGH